MKYLRFLAMMAMAGLLPLSLMAKDFSVLDFGAKGDGTNLDTAPIQRAIDAAAAANGRVVIPHWRNFLTGTLQLRSGIDFHISGDLILSTNPADYSGDALLIATNTIDLKITGGGKISGHALDFMSGYDAANSLWVFKSWRPAILTLAHCRNTVVRDITIDDAPSPGVQMLACDNALVDNITVKDRLDVPDNNAVVADHSRYVGIQNCDLTCGDDAVVIKSSRHTNELGECANVYVQNCKILTQSAGLKIGTETTGNIRDVSFDRCNITSSGRGLCIQLRDEGEISGVAFRNITLASRYQPDWWWGHGEPISFTAFPREAGAKVGKIHDILVQNVSGKAENSVRINGSPNSPIQNIRLENVSMNFSRWTKYPGAVYDNRPTRTVAPLEPHATDGFNISFADHVTLSGCSANWMATNNPDYFLNSVASENARNVRIYNFHGESETHPIDLK